MIEAIDELFDYYILTYVAVIGIIIRILRTPFGRSVSEHLLPRIPDIKVLGKVNK